MQLHHPRTRRRRPDDYRSPDEKYLYRQRPTKWQLINPTNLLRSLPKPLSRLWNSFILSRVKAFTREKPPGSSGLAAATSAASGAMSKTVGTPAGTPATPCPNWYEPPLPTPAVSQ